METLLFFLQILPYLIGGVIITLELTVLSFIIGFILGILIAAARVIGPNPLPALSKLYIEIFRGTPLLIQLLFIYFGLPQIGIKLNPFTASVIAIGLNSGAYQAEILRTAIKSIPEEQYMSASSLNLTIIQTYRYIVLPQSLRIAIPALVNEIVALIKYSSLASVIGLSELTRRGEYMVAYTFKALEVYFIVAILYLALCLLVSQLSSYIERKYSIPGYRRAII